MLTDKDGPSHIFNSMNLFGSGYMGLLLVDFWPCGIYKNRYVYPYGGS